MSQRCFTWAEADFTWSNNEYTWDDVCLTLELLAGHGDFYQWDEKKQQKFLTLFAKVKLQTEPELFYEMRVPEQTNRIALKEVKITAEDIKLVIENVLKVTVEI